MVVGGVVGGVVVMEWGGSSGGVVVVGWQGW